MGSAPGHVHVFLRIIPFGLDLSITSAVLVVWAAAATVFFASLAAVRSPSLIPGRLQNALELVYEFFESGTNDLFKEQSEKWLPFIMSLFLFIFVSNIMGLIPNVYPITANINVTVALAVMVFFVYHIAGILDHGLLDYARSLVPGGVPVYIMPLLVIVELLGHLARPFSLAIRLFANMTAGHLVAFTLLSLIFVFKSIWVAGLPLLGGVVIGLFEVFVALIQAYVFSYLAALYIGLAIGGEH